MVLATFTNGRGREITAFRDGVVDFLARDSAGQSLRLYFYSARQSGWGEIREPVRDWLAAVPGRQIVAYCSIAEYVTEPEALQALMRDLPAGSVHVIKRNGATFHAKAVVVIRQDGVVAFLGSNNLTGPGLLRNLELGAEIAMSLGQYRQALGLRQWERAVHRRAVLLTRDGLAIYREEYRAHAKRQRLPTIVGQNRMSKPRTASSLGLPPAGSVVLEVMPRETGAGGTQLQLPILVARSFFRLPPGGSVFVRLHDVRTGQTRRQSITDYGNNTRRLTISRLTHDTRPCVVWFARIGGRYEMDIVSDSEDPTGYRRLLGLCIRQTSSVSKRWGAYEESVVT